MEEQEGKTWEGTASDLKEIIGEATGAEPTDEQPRLDIAALRDRDHPPEEKRWQPTHRDIRVARERSQNCAHCAQRAQCSGGRAENVTTDCATTRPIAPGESEGGGGRGRVGRNGRNSTASFWEWGRRASVRSCCVAWRPPAAPRRKVYRPRLNCSPVRCIGVAWKSGYGMEERVWITRLGSWPLALLWVRPGSRRRRRCGSCLRVRLETLCLITVPCEPPCEESDVGDKNPCLCGGD